MIRPAILAGAGALAIWLAPLAAAEAQLLVPGGEPIEIEASDSLEWLSDQKAYVARGNALVRQGDSQVTAAVITAYYRELPDGGTQIVRVTADGNVVVRTPTETAQGAHGVYDIERDSFILTGGDLRLVTPDETITATESLEYYASDGVAVARGDAVAISGTDELRAQVLTATFTTGPDGGQTLRTIHAEGDVQITTPTETARGEAGVYDIAAQTATLTGSVRLTRGENQFNGDRAEVDLATGVSRLLSAPDGNGRVRALLVPGN